jgi:broad specificity phosphatase PhoE
MAVLWLTRHGNREDFVDPSWVDTAERPFDPGLSPDGVEQARRLGQRLRGEGIERIFASPFLRTVQTAHHVAEAIEAPIFIEPGLGEILYADWFDAPPEPLPFEEMKRRFPRLEAGHEPLVTPRYPESIEEAFRRSVETAEALVALAKGPILLVGHGASVTGIARGLSPAIDSIDCALCSIFKLVRDEGWRMELCGDVSHLDEAVAAGRFH